MPASDWPSPGPIDLKLQDLPHKSSAFERWYVNGHLHTQGSSSSTPTFSFFAVFLKYQFTKNWAPACAVSWAIVDTSDPENGAYHCDAVVDSTSILAFKTMLQAGKKDIFGEVTTKALLQHLTKGEIPSPDRVVKNNAKFSKSSPLSLDIGDSVFTRDDQTGKYLLKCKNDIKNIMLDLEFSPQREAERTQDGIVKVGEEEESIFQYSIPKLSISGKLSTPSLTVGNKETFEVSGEGWYAHEFGGDADKYVLDNKTESLLDLSLSGNFFSLQLSNNMEIAAIHLVDKKKDRVVRDSATVFSASHQRKQYNDLTLTVLDEWMSIRSSLSFPTKYKLTIPSANVDLIVEAAIQNQENISYFEWLSFWQGRVHVSGTIDGSPVTGYGFVEINSGPIPKLEDIVKRLQKEVRKEVEEILPLNPTFEQACNIVSSMSYKGLMKDFDIDVLVETIIKPLRTIIDRGGKSWRSYGAMLCIDCLGGDSNKIRFIQGIIEVAHVAALIQDDMQDNSDIRRGGPACHKIYGNAIAMNAASAAYFIAMWPIQDPNHPFTKTLTNEQKANILNTYFCCVRAVHCGQAIDLHGFDAAIVSAIESGDNTDLIKRVDCCYRLKTGAAFGFCIRVAAAMVICGNEEKIDALSNYMQDIAFAFQIIDDIVNLRGFDNNMKTRGEDITEGKITYPIVMAMNSALVPSKEARQSIFDRLKSKPNPPYYSKKMKEIQIELDKLAGQDDNEARKSLQEQYETNQKLFQQHEEKLNGLIDDLEKCGALEASNNRARSLIKEAEQVYASLLDDSRYKISFLAFSEFVLGQFGKSFIP